MSRSSSLKAQKRNEEDKLRKLRRRKTDVENVLDNVRNDFDGEINKINKKMDDLIDQQENGFMRFVHIYKIETDIRSEKEKSVYSDNNMSNVQDALSNEIRDINSKISTCESTISSLEGQIRQAEAEEAAERRRALEEALKKLTS